MIDLGAALTIGARGQYPFGESLGDIDRLKGFNELQHKVYGRIRHMQRGEEWTKDSFVTGLFEMATYYQILGDLRWSLRYTLPTIQ